jgi:magnesium-transporting ATPase (P-type)
MQKLSPEVLMYIQTVKHYFQNNQEAHDYFLGNTDEELFYEYLSEISQKNFDKDGEVMLNKEQFESLRKTMSDLKKQSNKTPFVRPQENIDIKIEENSNIFIEYPNFGKICLN